jgi:hypothetical protein
MRKKRSISADLPLTHRERQSRGPAHFARSRNVVVDRPQALPRRTDFLWHTKGLLTRNFRVAITGTIGLGRSTVRFVTLKSKNRNLIRLPEAGLWRGTREAWPRLFYV